MLGGDDGRTLYIVANHYSGSGASDGIVRVSTGRRAARRAPLKTLTLPGDDHTILVGDQRPAIEAIARFLDRTVVGGAVTAFRRAERKDKCRSGGTACRPPSARSPNWSRRV